VDTKYFKSCCVPMIITLVVTYCIGKHESKTIKKVFRSKLKLVLISVLLIILSQDSFISIYIKGETKDFVTSLFLTSC